MTVRKRLSIRPEQTTEFYKMPGWWITLVVVSAVVTGLGIGQIQDGLLPGAFTLPTGLGMAGLSAWLRWRAKKARR